MVQIIGGKKGAGKTKLLLDTVNAAIKDATGNIVYLDKNSKNMHELSNKVRLINVSDYPIGNVDEFIGFLCGIISQDYDLQEMYLDSFLTIGNIATKEEIEHAVDKLTDMSAKYDIKFVISMSVDKADMPENAASLLINA